MELSAVPSGFGWWSLHWRRSLLPNPQSGGNRLSPTDNLAGRRLNDGMGPMLPGN